MAEPGMDEWSWGDDSAIRWSAMSHYDAGFAAMKSNEYLAALCHGVLGVLMSLETR